MASRVIVMTKERETKNKVLYRADQGQGIDNIYIEKDSMREEGQRGYPDSIKITVEW